MSIYKNMEEVLKLINTKYITLDNEQVKRSNEILLTTLWDLIEIMKTQDQLFYKLFERPYFGGSYFDDLKVGRPDEFDLDLLLVLPKRCEIHKIKNCECVKVIPSNKPGFLWLQVPKGYCTALDRFIKDGYIQTNLVLNWLKSNLTIALAKLKSVNSSVYNYSVDPPTYWSESGPAITIQLQGSFGKIYVDLVPAFEFGQKNWPCEGFRSNQTPKADFFLVPKKAKGVSQSERYWRPSFQDQERELIKGKERLKPALRLLKKMRNNLVQSSISSYALKTIALLEVDTSYFQWSDPLSETFMKLLEKYKDCLENKEICYYWNENNNLLDDINYETLVNHHNEISRLLKTVKDKHTANPCIVAKVILKEGTTEYNEFIVEYNQRSATLIGISRDMPIGSSNRGSSSFTFNPRTTTGSNTFPTQDSTSYITPNEYSSRNSTLQAENSSSGWVTAGNIILGIGAAVAIGLGIFGAINRNNRD